MKTTMKKMVLLTMSVVLGLGAMMPAAAIERQKATNWCWASCIQDVMRQVGIHRSQEQVVARLTGWPRNRPAQTAEIVALLQSYGMRSWQAGRPASPQELYGTIQGGWKLIACTRPSGGRVGHVVVIQGIDPRNGAVIVSDPWTGRTTGVSLGQLYHQLRWEDSVVVGAPVQRVMRPRW